MKAFTVACVIAVQSYAARISQKGGYYGQQQQQQFAPSAVSYNQLP